MIGDPFRKTADSPIAPAEACFAIVPNDSADFAQATKARYVGLTSDIAVVPFQGDAPILFANVAGGSILPVRARAVHATGTTADQIVGLA